MPRGIIIQIWPRGSFASGIQLLYCQCQSVPLLAKVTVIMWYGTIHWFASLANALQGPEFLGQPDYIAKAGRQA
jgi:hypothetical protein